jgi:hypothetical protein
MDKNTRTSQNIFLNQKPEGHRTEMWEDPRQDGGMNSTEDGISQKV